VNRSGRCPRAPRRLPAAFLCVLLWAGAAAAQVNLVPEPVPSPDGDTSFVGSVSVEFPQLSASQRGKIYYTTNGTTPNASNGREYDYDQPIVITSTTTLKAVRIRTLVSSVV